jgi:hypothetical protein
MRFTWLPVAMLLAIGFAAIIGQQFPDLGGWRYLAAFAFVIVFPRGVPQESAIPESVATFYRNVTIAGGPAPVRAYIEELLPDVLEGRIEPGRVFDRTGSIEDVPDGYRAMNDRESIKVTLQQIGSAVFRKGEEQAPASCTAPANLS